MGSMSAWAGTETVYSWDFTTYATTTDIVTTNGTTLTEASVTCNLATSPVACEGLYFNDTWKCVRSGDSNPGLRNYSNGDRMVIIPNLKSGDVITLTGNADAIDNINTTKYAGTANEGKTTLTFTMEADGNFYFKMVKGGGKVNNITVYPTIRSIVVTRETSTVEVVSWNFKSASWTKESGFGSSTITINSQSCTYATGDLEGLALQGGSGTSWAVNGNGLSEGNGTRNIAILNLKAGDLVTVETNTSAISGLVNGTSTNDTYSGTCKFSVNTDGAFGFKVERYDSENVTAYTTSIIVYRERSVFVDEYNEVKTIANALKTVPNDNAAATKTLSDAISAQDAAVLVATTAEELKSAKSTLQNAINTFVATANPTTGNHFDLSYLLINPDIENVTNWGDPAAQGWFTDVPRSELGDYNNFATRTNLNSGKNAIERYTSDVCTTANTYALYQKVTLPAGNYSFDAYALANAATAIVMAAGNTEGDAITSSDFAHYSVNFIQASESETKVGIKISAVGINTCNWLAITGLKLFKEPATAVTGTIASSGYSSLASAYALDFSSATGINAAYIVSEASISAGTAKLEAVNELPAGEGVILKGTPGAAYSIPVITNASPVTNLLKGAVEAYDCAANEVYILKNGELHLVTEASTVPAGKAYLPADNVAAAPALMFVFADDMQTTGVQDVRSKMADVRGDIFDLQGRKVANPTKGLYIMNGKKVMVK